MKNFIKGVCDIIKTPGKFLINMLTGPNGDVSSKRFNGSELITAGVVLAFISKAPDAPERIKVLIYGGCILLGVMVAGDAIANIFGKKGGN